MEIRDFADTFDALQKARQQADYAHDAEYSKRAVLATINTAEDAIVEFERADARHRRSFAAHVLPRPIDRLQLLQPPPRPRAPLGRDSSGRR